ncbi:MAG: hypothetical protein OXC31_06300, partial [Spirochaetaceae bacterium]|nr:hypothetical protein [Spirochaetaceae bacterium]
RRGGGAAMPRGGRRSRGETAGVSSRALTALPPPRAPRRELAERVDQVQQDVASAASLTPERLQAMLEAAGFAEVEVEEEPLRTDIQVSQAWIDRLLGTDDRTGPLAQALREGLSAADLTALRAAAAAAVGRTVAWRRPVIYARATVSNSSS